MNWREIRYQPAKSGIYVGSPSVVRMTDGALIAYHDYFGRIEYPSACLSEIYRSEDNGATWSNICHIIGAFWGSLFAVGDVVYLTSCYGAHSKFVIRKSTDGGYTWSEPETPETGMLFPHAQWESSAPVQILNGRVFQDVEQTPPRYYPEKFYASVITAPLDCDLLNAANWSISNAVNFDHNKMREVHPELVAVEPEHLWELGWMEGNVLEMPDGSFCDLMRVHLAKCNRAALLNYSPETGELSFDYETGIIDFPGGSSKFTVRRDPVTKRYFTLSNPVPDDQHPNCRNKLTASWSDDLRHWHEFFTLAEDDSGLEGEDSMKYTGFQYAEWQFDGEDMICAVRTAYRGADTFHNSNRITFHVLKDFRKKAGCAL